MTIKEDINIIIKNRAQRLNISITNLCDKMGMSRTSFYNKLNGTYKWQAQDIPDLMSILKFQKEDIMDE